MLFASLQGIAGDSSFIASLAVSADYEKRFKTRLVTRSVLIPDHLIPSFIPKLFLSHSSYLLYTYVP